MYVPPVQEFKHGRESEKEDLIVMSDDPPYQFSCLCFNFLSVVDAEFKCFDSNGQVAYEVTVLATPLPQLLQLEQATGNTIIVEHFKLPDRHEHDGCYSVNTGDIITLSSIVGDYVVTINKSKGTQVDCPGS